MWRLQQISVKIFAESIYTEDLDEDFEVYTDLLAEDLRLNGLQRPVVIGLGSIEGHHRIVAAYKAGYKRIHAYVANLER